MLGPELAEATRRRDDVMRLVSLLHAGDVGDGGGVWGKERSLSEGGGVWGKGRCLSEKGGV